MCGDARVEIKRIGGWTEHTWKVRPIALLINGVPWSIGCHERRRHDWLLGKLARPPIAPD